MFDIYYLTALAIGIICIAIAVIAVIRLRLCDGAYRARLKYTLVMLSAIIGLTQPYFLWLWPNASALLLSGVVLYLLIYGAPALSDYKDQNTFFDTNLFDHNIHGEND